MQAAAGAGDLGGRDGAGSVGSEVSRAGTAHPGSGGDATSAVTRPKSPVHKSSLRVPFLSPREVEITCGFLAPDAKPHGGAIQKELTVAGNALAGQWTAEDPRHLRISIRNFLTQLFLVVQTMQRFRPLVSCEAHAKGA
ncbi:EKC/KEOPS complex subunit LAGE3-like [Choloepus didactylus]|uniref:EKC/KEOPS complex subunit LAGE3-like n=1 Tax=Choloepus didactylus TaxID=27675 RepID=UPI00189CFE4A|nr:EKC/KEOPS complex subunit LAGE3-like [Choloepus didactylus]